MADRFQIESEGNGPLFVWLTRGERLADGTDNGALTTVMGILIVAHAITADEISLILHRTSTGENLPGILTALWPVGYGDDGIILQGIRITTPYGEPQVVARQEQNAEAAVFHDGMG